MPGPGPAVAELVAPVLLPLLKTGAPAADCGQVATPPWTVMLAAPVEDLPRPGALRGGAQYEPKFDGWRGCLLRTDRGSQLRSRPGRDITALFPELAAAADAQLSPGTTLDGELVIWSGHRIDFAALQQRSAHPGRVAELARAAPAGFLAFDLLDQAGEDLRPLPLRERRRRLEDLAAGLAPPLQLVPATTDHDLARQWLTDYARAHVGVEGLVIKALDQPYEPGRRGWLKHKSRAGVDAVVGAVVGSATRPERLILGLPDASGELLVAGSTLPLRPAQVTELGRLLTPVDEAGHPWSTQLLLRHLSAWAPARRPIVTVEPVLVVEADAPTSTGERSWRELARYRRIRAELEPADLVPDT